MITPMEIREVCSSQATVDLRFALRAVGIGEKSGYQKAKYDPGALPFRVLRVGHFYKVPTASLLEVLGLTPLEEGDRQLTA